MKKIICLVIVFILCLSTITFANDNQWLVNCMLDLVNQTQQPLNIIGQTNEGFVVVRNEGVEVIPFDEFDMFIYGNSNAQNGRSMQNVVGNMDMVAPQGGHYEEEYKEKMEKGGQLNHKINPAIHIEPNSHQKQELPDW